MDSGGGNTGSDPAKTSTAENPSNSLPGCGCSSTANNSITVRVTPTTGGQFDLQVAKTESVENFKKLISKKLKVPKERICLLHRDRQLREGTLQENQLMDGSRLTLLPSVETGLLAQRPEQSVMQALESLNDTQVNDFLSGKAPLNLTMRLGDHMMLIQLQLSTVTPSSSRRSSGGSSSSSSAASSPSASPSPSKTSSSSSSALPPSLASPSLSSVIAAAAGSLAAINTSTSPYSRTSSPAPPPPPPPDKSPNHSSPSPSSSSAFRPSSSSPPPLSFLEDATCNLLPKPPPLGDGGGGGSSSPPHPSSSSSTSSSFQQQQSQSPSSSTTQHHSACALGAGSSTACKCDPSSSSSSSSAPSASSTSSSSSAAAASSAAASKPTLDTRALAEASRNLTQTLKQLSSEVLTSRSDAAEDSTRGGRRQGAIIESMHHHGKGVYSGTFSGTLNPALQDRYGRPKRDISTIIHILNDLLCATPQYRRHTRQGHSISVEATGSSVPKKGTNTSDKSSSSLEFMEESGSLSRENQATRGKMEHLRLIMEERRARRRARREARAAPYTTQWSAKSESLPPASALGREAVEPMETGDQSPSPAAGGAEQQLCELNPPEPVVA